MVTERGEVDGLIEATVAVLVEKDEAVGVVVEDVLVGRCGVRPSPEELRLQGAAGSTDPWEICRRQNDPITVIGPEVGDPIEVGRLVWLPIIEYEPVAAATAGHGVISIPAGEPVN